jgi:hypothetical protein
MEWLGEEIGPKLRIAATSFHSDSPSFRSSTRNVWSPSSSIGSVPISSLLRARLWTVRSISSSTGSLRLPEGH